MAFLTANLQSQRRRINLPSVVLGTKAELRVKENFGTSIEKIII